jgi:cytochrome c553
MFKAGTRISPHMQAVAQNLSESDIRTLAVFFSKQHPPLAPTSVPPTVLVTAGKQLAETGVGTSV